MPKERTQFCIGCREETTYRIQPVSCRKCIKDKEYEFVIAAAVCEMWRSSEYSGAHG